MSERERKREREKRERERERERVSACHTVQSKCSAKAHVSQKYPYQPNGR